MGGTPKGKILVVDDEAYLRTLLTRCLAAEGHQCEALATGEEAWKAIREDSYDLVVSDIFMAGMSGLELLALIRARFPHLGVVMMTAIDDRKTAIRALELGAYGYVIKPFEPNEIIISVAGALERRRLALASEDYQKKLEREVRERTRELRGREEEIAVRLVGALERRDFETGAHIRRIGLFSAALAEKLGWQPASVDEIRVAATMHDIGKMGISDDVLLKPGRFTSEEAEAMRRHTEIGGSILKGSNIPLIQMAWEIALYHHERWDGQGHPRGLRGREIPESARIVAIVDVYDALTAERVYKKAIPEDEVLRMMREERGKHFDPEIFDAFLEILPRLREIRGQVHRQFSAV